jgi:hypothetical protein
MGITRASLSSCLTSVQCHLSVLAVYKELRTITYTLCSESNHSL